MDEVNGLGRLIAALVVAAALSMLAYSLGYQRGHAVGFERVHWQLDLLSKRAEAALQAANAIEADGQNCAGRQEPPCSN